MKIRIMQDGHGKFFVQRKFLFWWVDECRPMNEFSDEKILFDTVEAAEKYAAYISGFYSKPKFVKTVGAIAEEGGHDD